MAAAGKPDKMTVNMSDEATLRVVKTILAYEAEIRGLTVGQASMRLILEAVDLDAYPDEVKDRLNEIREAARRRAVEKSLSMTDLQ